jgi:hypothetical protein
MGNMIVSLDTNYGVQKTNFNDCKKRKKTNFNHPQPNREQVRIK